MKDIKGIKGSKGQIIILFSLAIVALVGVVSLALDVGFQRLSQQKMKLATDSAALAGALELPNTTSARTKALEYCAANGFTDGVNGVSITTQVDPYGNNPNWYKVSVAKPASFLFGGLFGLGSKNINIFSTAEYKTYVPINITGGGVYGGSIDNMKYMLQVKGCDSLYSQGDPISVKKLDNGAPNPEYDPSGYNFTINVPNNYRDINGTTQVLVEVYDPDCKIHSGSVCDDGDQNITTVYTLYAPDNTPNDYSDDVMIGQASVGNTSATDEQWVQLTNANSTNFAGTFQFNSSTYGAGNYRLNVHSTTGYGSNGFSLRAGPPRTKADVSGALNINPNNNNSNEFVLTLPDGSQITRDDLHDNPFISDYTGPATHVHVKPKGNSNGNTIALDGKLMTLSNSDTYDFDLDSMTVKLWNDHRNNHGKATGQWWISIAGNKVTVTSTGTLDIPFDPSNGTSVTATGKLPLRFIRDETVTIKLGYVAASAAGTKMSIKKFDTDIGSTSLVYSCDTLAQTWNGVLAGNGEYKTDEISIPNGYTGGTWYAYYAAKKTDVSTWWMWYKGLESGEAGFVGLVE